MAETRRLEPGTTWRNQWSGERREVLELDTNSVKTRRLDPPHDEKVFPSIESFLQAYVSDP